MPIPHADSAFIPLEKLTHYLLEENHPVGGGKAKWFRSLGYDPADPLILEAQFLDLVQVSDDFTEKPTSLGTKYVVSGKMRTPNGQVVKVTTVWIVDPAEIRPRLVTAYPGIKS